MRYGSVCSGIEAATVVWKPLGWEAAWFSEIEKFPCAVLNHHYPDTPNLGDITTITEADIEEHGPITVLVGGTPCQSFSVAGLRKGLADPRGNLALRFLQLAGATRARWVCWENVPGVLSSDGGGDFGTFLGALAELGYGWAYRVLDAQWFGVAQRRRRVFVVGCTGDWRRAAAVLFERESLRRNPPPSREAGAGVARPIAHGSTPDHYDESQQTYVIPIHDPKSKDWSAREGAGIGEPGDPMFTLQGRPREAIAFDTTQVTSPDNYSNPKPGDACHPLASGQHPPAIAFNDDQSEQTRSMGEAEEQTPTLRAGGSVAVAFTNRGIATEQFAETLRSESHGAIPMVASVAMAVRRLTPVECARLQGFPDDYLSQVTYRGKCPPADGPMYKALGNSMAVPVMRWIGERIQAVELLSQQTPTS